MLVVVLAVEGPSHLRALSLLARGSGSAGWLATLYDTPIVEENLLLHSDHGPFRARIYRPRDGEARRGLVLCHGVHYMGIDEPRLVPFARNLARAGLVVLTPELGELADYQVRPGSVEEIEVAVRALASSRFVRPGGVGLLGLSFAGGLALLAASDPDTSARLRFVVSVGGHDDLARVTRFLVTGNEETPHGVVHTRAHDYGLAVFLYAHAERFVPAADVLSFRDALRLYLHVQGEEAVRPVKALSRPARDLWDDMVRGRRDALRPAILAMLPSLAGEMAQVSPAGHLASLRVPVYLIHGTVDDVVPPGEAEFAAQELRDDPGGVHLFLSPLFHHVTIDDTGVSAWQKLRLVHVMAAIVGS